MDSSAYRIDKRRVRASFGRAAADYDAAAVMQHEVFERMFTRLDLVKLQPHTILDAGCGPGRSPGRLAGRYRDARVLALDIALPMLRMGMSARSRWDKLTGRSRQSFICGDIEALPLVDNGIDLAWSNLAIQWCNDLDTTFREFHRILKPDGLLMFSTFGPDTLKELRQASNADAGYTHVNQFIDMHDIGDALVRAGFDDPVMDVEHFTLTYADVMSLMRDLKLIGAHNSTEGRRRGLEGRSFLQKIVENYEQFRSKGRLPATYEVVYGHAWKGQPKLAGTAQTIAWHPRR